MGKKKLSIDLIPSSIDGSHGSPSLFTEPSHQAQATRSSSIRVNVFIRNDPITVGRFSVLANSSHLRNVYHVLLGVFVPLLEISSSQPRVDPPVHRTSGQTYNLRILLVCDVVRRVPLTLCNPFIPPSSQDIKIHSRIDESLSAQQHHRHRGPGCKPFLTKGWNHMPTLQLVLRARLQSRRGRLVLHTCLHSIQTVQAPKLIRERVNKTPGALLCTALTSILRMKKTDFETLRELFGIRLPAPPSPASLV